jgi:hypothetical protein
MKGNTNQSNIAYSLPYIEAMHPAVICSSVGFAKRATHTVTTARLKPLGWLHKEGFR